uniref:Uncharacterized protein n=1 Tax=Cacopsylla melanoneura TaxID=428564 RepID=A0A8D9F6L3_9HEMI
MSAVACHQLGVEMIGNTSHDVFCSQVYLIEFKDRDDKILRGIDRSQFISAACIFYIFTSRCACQSLKLPLIEFILCFTQFWTPVLAFTFVYISGVISTSKLLQQPTT